MNCLLCNSKNIKFKFIYCGEDLYLKKLNIIDFELKWYECNDCGIFFSKQHMDIEKIYEDENVYDAFYDSEQIKVRFNKIMNLNEAVSDNVKRVKRCKDYHKEYIKVNLIKKEKFNILDIGAGLGVFLAKFLDYNYSGHALELNKVSLKHLNNVLPKVKIYQDFMQNLNFENKFDLITLNRVLEHIASPLEVITKVKQALHSKGLLYLELPDSLSYDLDGSSNEAFSSGHYMVYNSRSINYIFEKVGFNLMYLNRVKEPSGKFTVYAMGNKQ